MHAQLGDDAVQAEGGDTGLEGVPEHPIRVAYAAGVAPPAAEGFGQLGLADAAGLVDDTTCWRRAATSRV